jgi:hypothetical protein
MMIRHCERFPGGLERMAKADVTTTLADNFVPKPLKGSDGLVARDDG